MIKKLNKKFLITIRDKKFIFDSLESALKFMADFYIRGKGR
jgi:hypothetical protein